MKYLHDPLQSKSLYQQLSSSSSEVGEGHLEPIISLASSSCPSCPLCSLSWGKRKQLMLTQLLLYFCLLLHCDQSTSHSCTIVGHEHTVYFTHMSNCNTNNCGYHTSTALCFDPLMFLHFSCTLPPGGLQPCNTSCHFTLCTGLVLYFVSLHGSPFLSASLSSTPSCPLSVLEFFIAMTCCYVFSQLHHNQMYTSLSVTVICYIVIWVT